MSGIQYLVAKYVPDLFRFEPRNIGIIVWHAGQSAARFWGEKPGQPGEIDGRAKPPFIASDSTYRHWIRYWRESICSEAFVSPDSGQVIARSSPDIIQGLTESGTGNFHLVHAGEILEVVEPGGLQDLADDLFARLVLAKADETSDPTLASLVDQLIRRHDLAQKKHFKMNYPVHCRLDSFTEDYNFSYAVVNGKPNRLYQTVSLPPKNEGWIKKSADSTAWMFEKVAQAKILDASRLTALVYVTEETPALSNAVSVMRSVGRVLNLSDTGAAEAEFRQIAQLRL